MLLDRHNLLKRSLYSCLALLTVLPVSLSVANAKTSAKPAPKTTTQKVTPKAPWKQAWNKYARDESGYASVYLYPVKGKVPTATWYKYLNKRVADGNSKVAGTVSGWNQFYNRNQKSGQNKGIVSYPEYQHLSDAGYNARHLSQDEPYLVDVPYSDIVGLNAGNSGNRGKAEEADFKRAEMIANLPMADLTPKQENVLQNWAEPVKNGQRLTETFNNWMKQSHQHPQINIANNSFKYQNGSFEQVTNNANSGKTYQYNRKSGTYKPVNNNKELKAVKGRINGAKKAIARNNKGNEDVIKNNPIISKVSAYKVATIAKRPNTTQAQAYREVATTAPKSQAKKLQYSAQRAQKLQQASNYLVGRYGKNEINELKSLQTTSLFKNMSLDKKVSLSRFLLQHPDELNKVVNHYNSLRGVTAVNTDAQAKKAVKQADQEVKVSNAKSVPKNIISSDPKLVNALSTLHDMEVRLSSQQGMNVPTSGDQI